MNTTPKEPNASQRTSVQLGRELLTPAQKRTLFQASHHHLQDQCLDEDAALSRASDAAATPSHQRWTRRIITSNRDATAATVTHLYLQAPPPGELGCTDIACTLPLFFRADDSLLRHPRTEDVHSPCITGALPLGGESGAAASQRCPLQKPAEHGRVGGTGGRRRLHRIRRAEQQQASELTWAEVVTGKKVGCR
ncbi:hypothetical protein K466DRAFT_581561 [Polyporus arcularius HHB13444]|uniref:Uncharacterized protein n=1 Tax=Polyporus arcularius HHB13444 TaxID=1314778 RepID=A0A5C3PY41_9APHY|nr:hypothetical protein K466DRAFT_581561 [Polyporus arcularius HHB13444]